jgi:hypothetical protein
MNRFYGKIFVAICGLMLICGFGARAYAAHSCLTEVLPRDTKVSVVLTDRMLEYQMKKGEALAAIPKESVNDEGNALTTEWEFTLPSTKPSAVHTLKKPLVVQASDGRKFQLRENTDFSYTLPITKFGYKVTIPSGTSLTKVNDSIPQKYALNKDITAKIIPPKNYRLTLTIDAQRVVDRIPGTSAMGTTLTFKPQRAPMGEYITLTIAKSDFDFSKAQFYVCLRKQDEDAAGSGTQPETVDADKEGEQKAEEANEEANHEPFIASTDVELKAVQMGKAQLRVRIPDINASGPHEAIPVDLLVVARGPDGKMAEVMSRGLAVSSRSRAVWCWFFAIAIPWLVAGIITGRKEPKKRLRLNPIWFVSGKYGNASLSLAQILLWTILVFSASFYVLVVSGKLLDLTNEILMLLGIAGGSSVIAKISASTKSDKGVAIAAPEPKDPKWLNLFQTEGRPDLYKVQMALFTTLAAIFVTAKIYGTLEFPELPAGLLTLIGISNGVYLGAKATSKTVFEKLAGKSNELQQAEEELMTLTAAANKAQKDQQTAESEKTAAVAERDSTNADFDKETDADKKLKLQALLEQQKDAAKKSEERSEAADKKKTEADNAKTAAEKKVKDLKAEVEKLKEEALKQD